MLTDQVAVGDGSVRFHLYSKHVGQIIWDRLDCAAPCRYCATEVVVSPNICWNYWWRPDKSFFCPPSFFVFFLLLQDGSAWETLWESFGHCGDSGSSWTLALMSLEHRLWIGSICILWAFRCVVAPASKSSWTFLPLTGAFNFPFMQKKSLCSNALLWKFFFFCLTADATKGRQNGVGRNICNNTIPLLRVDSAHPPVMVTEPV